MVLHLTKFCSNNKNFSLESLSPMTFVGDYSGGEGSAPDLLRKLLYSVLLLCEVVVATLLSR